MSRTLAYTPAREIADGWEDIYASAVCSGIAPDQAHESRGGYHVGRRFQSARNYSVIRVDDRAGMGPNDASAAVDMSMNARDMKLCTTRLKAVWANKNDPRRKYINAFNGWLGSGPATRYDIIAGTKSTATSDHKWHVHLEIRRRWVNNGAAIVAILSALRGETVAAYLKRIGVSAPSAKPGGKTATAQGPKAPPYPGRVLRRNDHQAKPDPAVKTLQQRLIARGWTSIGDADGRFGPKLERGIKRFQTLCRVAPDGEVGPVTWPLPWTRPLGSDG